MDAGRPVRELRNNGGFISGGYFGDKMYSIGCNQVWH